MSKPQPETKPPVEILDASKQWPLVEILILGQYGTGKTQLAASACEVPAMGNVLVIDGGNSSDTLLGEPRFSKIQITRPRDFQEFFDIYAWLVKADKLGFGEDQYGTLIIDDLQDLYYKGVSMRLDKVLRADSARIEMNFGDEDWNIVAMQIQDWGVTHRMLQQALLTIRDLPCNLIVICLASREVDALSGRSYITAALPGQMADWVPSKLSSVWFMDVRTPAVIGKQKGATEPIYTVYFQPTGSRKARVRGQTRATRLGQSMDSPTMKRIYAKLFPEVKENMQ